MKKLNTKNKFLKLAWLPYFIILFEMLYMATPFAAFFYSVYELPLKFLNENTVTAWLIQTILPHFVETNSKTLHLLVNAGWMAMVLGALVFLVGFVQIYYAKFTKKGAVTGGIYNWIRHPQYAAWILFGAGMSLVWSRMIVWIMFASMIFVYYLLARAEEKECMEKFPDTYPPYHGKTGMFFPKIFNLKKSNDSYQTNRTRRPGYLLMAYVLTVSLTILGALGLRNYTISKMSTSHGAGYMAVSVSYIPPQLIERTVEIMLADSMVQAELSQVFEAGDPKMFYVMPQSWILPELGMTSALSQSDNPHANSASHGNPEDTSPMKKRVLVSMASLISETEPARILNYMKQQMPVLYVDIDIEQGIVTGISKPPKEGIYSDIPVPLF